MADSPGWSWRDAVLEALRSRLGQGALEEARA